MGETGKTDHQSQYLEAIDSLNKRLVYKDNVIVKLVKEREQQVEYLRSEIRILHKRIYQITSKIHDKQLQDIGDRCRCKEQSE